MTALKFYRYGLRPEFFLLVDLQICFVEKNDIFLRFCLCIFDSDTVKSDCSVQIFREMIKF